MSVRPLCRIIPLVAVLGLVGLTPAARPQPPAAKTDVDPLPKGAKARYGLGRLAGRAWATPAPPDYSTLLVPDADGGIRAFDAATGRPAKPDATDPGRQPGPVGSTVAVSADGKRAVVVRSGILSVRDVATGEAVASLRPVGATAAVSGVSNLALSADGSVLALGGQAQNGRGEVVVWDVAKGEVVRRVTLGVPGVPLPTLSADGKLVAARPLYHYDQPVAPNPPGRPAPAVPVADPGPAVTVWGVDGGKELFKARLSAAGVQTGAAFSPDGKLLATGAGDGPVDLWEVPSGKPVRTLLGRTGQGVRVAFSADGQQLAAVATDGTIQRWAVADGKPAGTTEPPADLPPVQPAGVGFAPNGRVVAWGSAGATTLVWEAPAGKLVTPVGEHTGPVRSIGVGAGGKELVTAGSDGRVVRWELATGKPLGAVAIRPPRAGGYIAPGIRGPLALAADATRAVTLGLPSAVYDVATGAELFAVPRGPTNRYTTHQFPSPDLSRVAVLSIPFDPRQAGKCTVWDLVNQKRAVEFDVAAVGGPGPAAGFSPDGNRLVTVTTNRDPVMNRQGTVMTGWDLTTGKKLGEVEDPTLTGIAAVAVADDRAAVVAAGGRVWAVDYEAGRRGDDVDGAGPGRVPGVAEAVAFAPGGGRFAAGFTDPAGGYGLRVYDWPRGKELWTFLGHGAPVTALAFTPDGNGLISGSADTTAILWDLSSLPGGK